MLMDNGINIVWVLSSIFFKEIKVGKKFSEFFVS